MHALLTVSCCFRTKPFLFPPLFSSVLLHSVDLPFPGGKTFFFLLNLCSLCVLCAFVLRDCKLS